MSTLRNIILLISLVVFLFSHAEQANHKERNIAIQGKVIDNASRLGIKDTIHVEAISIDSTLLAQADCNVFYNKYPDETSIFNPFRLIVTTPDNKIILKLSHPDYKTAYIPVSLDKPALDLGDIPIRKLTRFEKTHNLQEVTVTASIVQFVNKGDTVSFNADAFNLDQGSMLDALIEQLPGAEINEQGQIHVNGQFIDKLMLNGKDFFKDNQLVLMRNLPAYAVKNIKIYEEASTVSKVLGKNAQDGAKKDPLVMDLILKKSYKASWIANAEAGAGSNHRYRGRAFATGYSSAVRLGAYAFLNNINETRNPGRSGTWTPTSSRKGITSTKEGGIDYQLSSKDSKFDFNGSAITSYRHQDDNSRASTENFLTTGSQYSRNWTDIVKRDLKLSTNHTIELKPPIGSNYGSKLNLSLSYQDNKADISEATANFKTNPGNPTDLKEQLTAGFPEDLDIINKYLHSSRSKSKDLLFNWDFNTTFKINSQHGLSILGNGNFNKGNFRDNDNSLLQTISSPATITKRENPKEYHSYQYWLGMRFVWKPDYRWTFSPSYGFCHW